MSDAISYVSYKITDIGVNYDVQGPTIPMLIHMFALSLQGKDKEEILKTAQDFKITADLLIDTMDDRGVDIVTESVLDVITVNMHAAYAIMGLVPVPKGFKDAEEFYNYVGEVAEEKKRKEKEND